MTDRYTTIGQYVLFKEILRDDIGTMYRAREVGREGWGKNVWLRVLSAPGVTPETLAEQKDLVNRLGRDLQAGNVVSGSELHIIDDTPVLAWDHAPGHTLSQVFKATREEGFPVPVDNALLIIEKLSLALSAGLAFELDGRRLVHGFLHPGLVVVSNEGEALVAGFGLAEQLLGVLDEPESREHCAPYLAPEVLEARSTTNRSDVYSLGSILFELLTGAPLPADPTAREVALNGATLAMEEDPVPDDIMILLRKSLAPNPGNRFGSAADFKKELDKLLYGGNYSPTTFNLALFIDRLFRADIEEEEREALAESQVDPEPYLRPEPEEETPEEALEAAKARSRAGMWIAIAAALVLIAVAVVVLGPRFRQPKIPPTPTPEEVAAQKAAEQQRFEALVQEELQRMLAEQQAKAQEELDQRQKEIESLQKKLNDVQKGSTGQKMSAAQQKQADALKQQLAKAEEEKKAREARLEEERQKALEEARRKAQEKAAQATPTPAPAPPEATTAPEPQPTATTAPASQPAAPAQPAAQPTAAAGEQQITEGMYLPPTEVDTPPIVLRKDFPKWSRMAMNSRRRGVVIVSARVNAKGRVESVKVLRADDKGFGIPKAAMDSVSDYLFKPATKNRIKVATDATVAVPYSFRGR